MPQSIKIQRGNSRGAHGRRKSHGIADKDTEIYSAGSGKFPGIRSPGKLGDIANSPVSLRCIVDKDIAFNLAGPQKLCSITHCSDSLKSYMPDLKIPTVASLAKAGTH